MRELKKPSRRRVEDTDDEERLGGRGLSLLYHGPLKNLSILFLLPKVTYSHLKPRRPRAQGYHGALSRRIKGLFVDALSILERG